MRAAIARAAGYAQLVAAGLVAASAVRLLVFSVLHVVELRSERLAPRPSTSAPELPGLRSVPEPPEPPAQQPRPSAQKGAAIRITASIMAGPPRSEVFVNGVSKGHTPFLGDISCKAGEQLKIEIVPEKGKLLRYTRSCLPGTLRIVE